MGNSSDVRIQFDLLYGVTHTCQLYSLRLTVFFCLFHLWIYLQIDRPTLA